ncbi:MULTISPECIES: (d)CMP kinase [unclassified Ruminococcus]|uniref:(d)CMP kinase n=1 Tax=unclassified Ruminococcus TaxID=2608920 RepID=UPI0021091870|nr:MULTISPECIES: (d)CMP kinase [unclassified Ruminococcus]MCQ4021851.1 (d)CMP kinase [Ruminococcus sp. zg-924]MCQ4114296.1 (d)CMP kinase [Ruminococcus sp. zg-921]
MISVAIDGPAGAGKSTIAKTAAKRLNFIYVDTGALYRTLGYGASVGGVDIHNEAELERYLENSSVELKFIDGEQRVFLNGQDVSDKIRTPQMGTAASEISAIPMVREYLLGMQRALAKSNNVIMDGRDIGTVVLPNAEVKIFLTASPECRAKRRLKDFEQKGEAVDYDEVLRLIKERDYQDSHREIAPLKPAEDSVIVDNSQLDLEQSIEKIISIVQDRIAVMNV